MILNIPVLSPLFQVSKWHPTKTRSKTISPFTVKLQQEQTTKIKSSKIEITKEGVSRCYFKEISSINIFLLLLPSRFEQICSMFLKEKRWNMVRWICWATGQPPRKQRKDSEPHPQSDFVCTEHRNRRTNYSHKPVHLYFSSFFFLTFVFAFFLSYIKGYAYCYIFILNIFFCMK